MTMGEPRPGRHVCAGRTGFPVGGAEGIRTPGLLIANETRYQLRHSPRSERNHNIGTRPGRKTGPSGPNGRALANVRRVDGIPTTVPDARSAVDEVPPVGGDRTGRPRSGLVLGMGLRVGQAWPEEALAVGKVPEPVLARLEARDHLVARLMPVRGRVLRRAGVTAPDVTALGTPAQVHHQPPLARHSTQPVPVGTLCSSIPARVVILGPTLRVRRRGRRAGPSSAPRRSARSRRAGPRTSRRAVPRRAPSPRRPRRCRGHRGRDTPWRPR